eukprot:3719541-Lingulodinium_polyedra.AAC.1
MRRTAATLAIRCDNVQLRAAAAATQPCGPTVSTGLTGMQPRDTQGDHNCYTFPCSTFGVP